MMDFASIERELARRTVRHQVGIFRGFLARISGLGGDAQTAQPLYHSCCPQNPAAKPQRVALLRAQRSPFWLQRSIASSRHFSIGMLRVIAAASAPSAMTHFAPGCNPLPANEFQADPGPFGTAQQTNKI